MSRLYRYVSYYGDLDCCSTYDDMLLGVLLLYNVSRSIDSLRDFDNNYLFVLFAIAKLGAD